MEVEEEDDFIDIHDERFHASVRENIVRNVKFYRNLRRNS